MKLPVPLACCLLLLSSGIPAGRANAQNVITTGTIRGMVTDQSAAAFPAATVILKDTATGKTYRPTNESRRSFCFFGGSRGSLRHHH